MADATPIVMGRIAGPYGIRGWVHVASFTTPPENLLVIIDKSERTLQVFEDGKTIASFPVAIGDEKTSTPEGDFTIANKLLNPDWFRPGGRTIPAGHPDNPLGSCWLGLKPRRPVIPPNYGIHGTNEPASIGKPATLGCIRLRDEDAKKIFELIPEGTHVKVCK